MPSAPANQIAGRTCPPVICQRRGYVFRWHDGTAWVAGDALPLIILDQQPACERLRLCAHGAFRRDEAALRARSLMSDRPA